MKFIREFYISGDPQVIISATAYPYRNKVLLYQLSDIGKHGGLHWKSFKVLQDLMDSVTQSLASDEWAMYANFIDTELDGNTAQRLCCGENLPRQKDIKALHDPKDMFWNSQGIAPIVQ